MKTHSGESSGRFRLEPRGTPERGTAYSVWLGKREERISDPPASSQIGLTDFRVSETGGGLGLAWAQARRGHHLQSISAVTGSRGEELSRHKKRNLEGSNVGKTQREGAIMKPTTPRTDLTPSTQLRKAAFGGAARWAVSALVLAIGTSHTLASPGAWDKTYTPTVTGGVVYAMGLQPDGRLLIGGAFTAVNNSSSRRCLARLFADGSLDTTFFNSGSGVSSTIWCLAVQTDGRIVIGGDFASVSGTTRTRVARLNSNGSVDGSFVPTNVISGSVLALAAQSNNKVVIGGSFSSGSFPRWNARLNVDGTTDTTFSSYPDGAVNAVAIQGDGKILIGGDFTTVNGAPRYRIARLNSDGSLDNTFQSGLSGASSTVRCLQIQSDGKILIGGNFSSVNNTSRGYVARLNSNGSLDAGFASSLGANNPVYAIAVQPDNSVLIGGAFSMYASASVSRVARLFADGTRDTTFTNFGINNIVRTLAVQSDGAILTGGTFTTINNTNCPYLGRLYGDLYPPEFLSQPVSRNTNVGATVIFSVQVNNPTPSNYQWRKDGNNLPGATGMSYTLYNVQVADSGVYSVFVSNGAGGTTSSNAVLNVGAAPSITTQPSSLTVTQGQSATFTVSASGTPLSYYWRKNSVHIPGATNASYIIPSTAASDAAAYSVIVSNALGVRTSANAVLTVTVPVSITVQPTNLTAGEGSTTTFAVTVAGTSPKFQWHKNGTRIMGATGYLYSINSVQFSDAADYTVVVTNIINSVTSQVATLTVERYPPAITDQPASQSIPVGGNVTFAVGATGTTLNYQWQKEGANILDATAADLTLTNVSFVDVGDYRVIVTNLLGSATSIVATLTVGYPPAVIEPPQSSTNLLCRTVELSCTVTGTPPMNLQWLFNGAPLADQTNSTLTLPDLQATHAGSYALSASNAFGGTVSPSAQISIFGTDGPATWKITGALNTRRQFHTATLLPNGLVLVAGGTDNSGHLSSTELFDPATGSWMATGAMGAARWYHTATLLPNGKVLVAGGTDNSGYLSSAELYDPATGTWTATDAMASTRFFPTATLLPNGLVLVTGGYGNSGYLSSAELFDPATGTWTATGAMTAGRQSHTTTLLTNGLVLVAGGNGSSGCLSSAELYDPATGTWTATGVMTAGRSGPTATLLPNGLVLVAGGYGSNGYLPSAELYDPATGTWTTTGAMTAGCSGPTATLLPNGQVLVLGGYNGSSVSSAVLYDTTTGTWAATEARTAASYYGHTATLLLNGKVLVVGGWDGSNPLSSAELYASGQSTVVVTLGNLSQSYDGTAKSVSVTTTPPGLLVDVTYDGLGNAPTNVGSYTVIGTINDPCYQGSATNTLVITTNPQITQQPIGGLRPVGSNFAFTVTATGTGTLVYQWQKDGVDIPGATASDYHRTNLSLADSGVYTVVVTNSLNSVTSSMATLTVGYPPMVVDPPQSSTNLLCRTVVLSCTVTGTVPLDVQWLFNSTPLVDQTNATLTLPDLQASNAGSYALSASNAFGGTVSPSAQISVYGTGGTAAWRMTGPMATGRSYHTATRLANGKVLAAGGWDGTNYLSSAELYDTATRIWTTTSPMNAPRMNFTATLLPNGKVLIAGGGNGPTVHSSCELYDPTTGLWTPTGAMLTTRYGHTATLLLNGKVLVVAGCFDNPGGQNNVLSTVEIYDPTTGMWTATGAMSAPRAAHTQTLLSDGRVLVSGGVAASGTWLSSAGIYNPATGTWTDVASMNDAHLYHTATLLPDGRLLIAGSGWSGLSAELFNPSSGIWTATAAMHYPRQQHTATMLNSGQLLVAGGGYSLSELYDPSLGAWLTNGALNTVRTAQTATMLLSGAVLVAGGVGDDGYATSSAELYESSQDTVTVTLGNLSQTYDGTAKSVSATITPPGLLVDVTYDGSASAPTNAGNYTVIGTINDPCYQGGATNTLVIYPAASILTGATTLANGAFQFTFVNSPGALFSVLTTTNLALPLSDWTVMAGVTEVSPGQFQFTDPRATNASPRFYCVRSP